MPLIDRDKKREYDRRYIAKLKAEGGLESYRRRQLDYRIMKRAEVIRVSTRKSPQQVQAERKERLENNSELRERYLASQRKHKKRKIEGLKKSGKYEAMILRQKELKWKRKYGEYADVMFELKEEINKRRKNER